MKDLYIVGGSSNPNVAIELSNRIASELIEKRKDSKAPGEERLHFIPSRIYIRAGSGNNVMDSMTLMKSKLEERLASEDKCRVKWENTFSAHQLGESLGVLTAMETHFSLGIIVAPQTFLKKLSQFYEDMNPLYTINERSILVGPTGEIVTEMGDGVTKKEYFYLSG